MTSMGIDPFPVQAGDPSASLDQLALALAGEFRPVDAGRALDELDALGTEVGALAGAAAPQQAEALTEVLGRRHGFTGDQEQYDHPDNSMLDLVLTRRRGLPILLSVVYVEVARRAGIPLAGVGLPGHFVVGHFGESPPLLLDPFHGGGRLEAPAAFDPRPWRPHQTALRMLNNLVGSYLRRADLGRAIRAGEMRLELPVAESDRGALELELRALRARLN